MANQKYENFIIENRINDLLDTHIDMNAYLTADNSLAENPGMIKKIHKYGITGDVEELAMGVGNSEDIEATMTEEEYRVGVTQGRFTYFDEEAMTDPMVVETGVKGLAAQMTNDLTSKAISAMDAASLQYEITAWNFDAFADAIALYPYENEDNLFVLINPAQKASIRKALGQDLKYSEGFARTGYIGHVCGVPVIVSKAVPDGIAYLGTKEAVTCFVKKGVEVEQDRDPNTRKNQVFARKVMLVALTDATRMIKMGTSQATSATITTYTKNAKTVAGAATTGAEVKVYINGVLDGSATASGSAYSYTAKENLATGDVVKVIAKVEGKLDSIATVTVA